MTITWRNAGPWGPASVTVDLTSLQVDYNFWDHEVRIRALEAGGRQVVSISQAGNALTFHMSDYSTEGPFVLGSFVLNWTSPITWQSLHVYSVNDAFVQGSSAYTVIFGHTSASSFDANANDGHGHNYYKLLMTLPSGTPTGGVIHQVLAKNSSADYDSSWVSSFVPTAGLQRQILMKDSASNYDYSWHDIEDAHLQLVDLFDTVFSSLTAGDLIHWVATGSGTGHFSNISLANLSLTTSLLTDFLITSPSNGDLLQYNTGDVAWENVPVSVLTLSVAQKRNSVLTDLGSVSGTVSLDPALGDVFRITPTGAVTLNAASAPTGARITLEINASATSYNITFSSFFDTVPVFYTGTSAGKHHTITFESNGALFREVSRVTRPTDQALVSTGTVSLDLTVGRYWQLTPTGNVTIQIPGLIPTEFHGKIFTIVVTTSGTSSRNITFDPLGFLSQGVLATGVVSGKTFVVTFVCTSVGLVECSRTTAM